MESKDDLQDGNKWQELRGEKRCQATTCGDDSYTPGRPVRDNGDRRRRLLKELVFRASKDHQLNIPTPMQRTWYLGGTAASETRWLHRGRRRDEHVARDNAHTSRLVTATSQLQHTHVSIGAGFTITERSVANYTASTVRWDDASRSQHRSLFHCNRETSYYTELGCC